MRFMRVYKTAEDREGIMRRLALSDDILLKIEKPARYIGGEINSVMKDPESIDIRFAMCFPDPVRSVQPQGRYMVRARLFAMA